MTSAILGGRKSNYSCLILGEVGTNSCLYSKSYLIIIIANDLIEIKLSTSPAIKLLWLGSRVTKSTISFRANILIEWKRVNNLYIMI